MYILISANNFLSASGFTVLSDVSEFVLLSDTALKFYIVFNPLTVSILHHIQLYLSIDFLKFVQCT